MKNKLVLPEYLRKNLDKYKYVLIACCLGLILAAQPGKSTISGQSGGKEQAGPAEAAQTESLQQAETRLAELLGQIEGVGRVQVMLTARRGAERNYAYNTNSREGGGDVQRSNELQNELVIVSGGGTEQPVLSSVSSPEYQGALVVCDGADSPRVLLEVTQAVKALTGIPADRIQISKMK